MRSQPPHTCLAITMGDPAGVGPEVTVKALHDLAVLPTGLQIVVVGDRQTLTRYGCPNDWHDYQPHTPHPITVFDLANVDHTSLTLGQSQPAGGRAALEYVNSALDLVCYQEVQGLVTAPLDKAAVLASGVVGDQFVGHTEYLAQHAGDVAVAMAMVSEPYRVVLATTHHAVKNISDRLTVAQLLQTLQLTTEFCHQLGSVSPCIAVTGLNPHAGEQGHFGSEEIEVIQPAIQHFLAQQRSSVSVTGPLPADTLFIAQRWQQYDAIVAMYHDQALIPIKQISHGHAVNVTIGLGFVRTSPDHGTAYDIVGTDQADPQSMVNAIQFAMQMLTSA